MAGRLTKRTPECEGILIEALSAGHTRRAACAAAGISDQTLLNWCHRSLDFLEAITRAEMTAQRASVERIRQAAVGGQLVREDTTITTRQNGDVVTRTIREWSQAAWSADAWWLERRYPNEFGKIERLQIDVELRREAERIARDNGLDADEVYAEALAVIKASK